MLFYFFFPINRQAALTGQTPNLTLSIQLTTEASRELNGKWRLALTNQAGTGEVDFIVGVYTREYNIISDIHIALDN